jgi:cytochrome c-type biogenesis protein CcmH
MRYFIFCCLLVAPLVHAVVETYEFDNEAQRQRYQQFVAELRCPKCQNQNLAGSDSPIAEDLRRELYRLLQEGHDDQQIIEYMVNRYGEFILYRPRFNAETALLWLAPLIFLVAGALVVARIFRRQQGALTLERDPTALSDSEQQQLQQLLTADADKEKTHV